MAIRKKRNRVPVESRFWCKVNKTETCWNWTSSKTNTGYGVIGENGKLMLAHRIAYRLHFGHLPVSALVLHKCDNPGCVNPAHLWIGTQKDNMRDKSLKGRLPNFRFENNPRAKLTRDLVKEIRSMYATGQFSHNALSEVFGVSKASIYNILKNKTWS